MEIKRRSKSLNSEEIRKGEADGTMVYLKCSNSFFPKVKELPKEAKFLKLMTGYVRKDEIAVQDKGNCVLYHTHLVNGSHRENKHTWRHNVYVIYKEED